MLASVAAEKITQLSGFPGIHCTDDSPAATVLAERICIQDRGEKAYWELGSTVLSSNLSSFRPFTISSTPDLCGCDLLLHHQNALANLPSRDKAGPDPHCVDVLPSKLVTSYSDLPPSMCPHPELGCGC